MSRTSVLHCDIQDLKHNGDVKTRVDVPMIFDHDQEDGKSKTKPYLEIKDLEMCDECWDYMMEKRRLVYAYGSMGFNKYYLLIRRGL